MIRMSVNRILPFLLLLVLFTSCNRKYKIEGSSSVTSLDGKMLFLKTLRNGQWVNVDSAEVIHGHFKMKGRTDSVMMVTLYMDQEGIMPLVLEDGKIVVSISNTQLIAKGTSLNDKLYEFIDKRNSLEVKIEELERKEARMVRKFMGQRGVQFVVPRFHRPVFLFRQRGKRAVIELDIAPHLIVAVFPHNVNLTRRKFRIFHCLRQQGNTAVQLAVKDRRELFCHGVKAFAYFVKR